MRTIHYLILLLMTVSLKAQVVIHEFLSSNQTINYDKDVGQFSDWLELLNGGGDTVDIKGWYISDDASNRTKWKFERSIPLAPGKTVLVWCDDLDAQPGDTIINPVDSSVAIAQEFHSSFKLKSSGEFLSLTGNDLVLRDSLSYSQQRADLSFGHDSSWISRTCLSYPSPGSRNFSTPLDENEELTKPLFATSPGFYSGAVAVDLVQVPGEELRYTLDGSIPNFESSLYSGSIVLNSTTVVKVKAFKNGKVPSVVNAGTYLIGEGSELPIVSLSCDPTLLDDQNYGLFSKSLKDKEVPVTLEMFENAEKTWGVNAGMEIFGTNIFVLDQKPMSFKLKDKYGDEILNYPLFGGRDVDEYSHFVLRNGGNDNPYTMLRDGFFGELIKGQVDVDYQAYRPVQVLVNGSYWGMYHFREKINEQHLGRNHKIADNLIDVLEENQEVNAGSTDSYQYLLKEIGELEDTSSLSELEGIMDVDEYINYAILKIYAGYVLLTNNNKYWSSQEDLNWRWVAFDLEHGFQCCFSHNYPDNTLAIWMDGSTLNMPEWSYSMFRDLMGNDEFKNRFVARFQTQLQTVYTAERAIATIDSMQNLVTAEMNLHIGRWGSPTSFTYWVQQVDLMRNYAAQRPSFLWSHLDESLGLAGKDTIVIGVDGQGEIELNQTLWTRSERTGLFSVGLPLTIRAVPDHGQRFKQWSDGDTDQTRVVFVEEIDSIEAVFEEAHGTLMGGIVTGDSVLTLEKSPYWVESDLVIDSTGTLTIEAGVEVIFSASSLIEVRGGLYVLGDTNQVVRLKGNGQSLQDSWSGIVGQSPMDSIVIRNCVLLNAESSVDKVGVIDVEEAHLVVEGVELVSKDQPIYSKGGTVSVSKSSLGISLPGDIINVVEAGDCYIGYNRFAGSKAEDVDAIDLDGVDSALVEFNSITRLEGYNSDGIDLGEGASNVWVIGNRIENCSDKGVSVGQGSECVLRGNTIIGCGQGVGIKDEGSYARLERQTFAFNDIGVAVFEKNKGAGGGEVAVSSSLFVHNLKDTWVDYSSSGIFEFCHSDTSEIQGSSNTRSDPKIENLGYLDFNIDQSSPLKDLGDPSLPLDLDGSRADIGALPILVDQKNLVINEINYRSESSMNSGDWLEIFNDGADIDVTGWTLTDHQGGWYVFPEQSIIASGSYLVIAEHPSLFAVEYPGVLLWGDSLGFGLSNGGERISLLDAGGDTYLSLRYSDDMPWCVDADGLGKTLELKDEEGDMAYFSNWSCSEIFYGTPGRVNSILTSISSFSGDNFEVKCYPNPVTEYLSVYFPHADRWSYSVRSISGRELLNSPATYLSQTRLDLTSLPAGIYLLSFKSLQSSYTQKLEVR